MTHVLYSNQYTDVQRMGLIATRDAIIGDPDAFSTGKPVKSRSGYSGGTAYERSPRAIHVASTPRSYSASVSRQNPLQSLNPTAVVKNVRLRTDAFDKHLEINRLLIEVIHIYLLN